MQGLCQNMVGLTIRASPFPMKKRWTEWQREFALSVAQRLGRGGRIAAVRWLVGNFSSRFEKLNEHFARLGGCSEAQGAAGAACASRSAKGSWRQVPDAWPHGRHLQSYARSSARQGQGQDQRQGEGQREGRGRWRGRGAEPMEVSSESEEDTSAENTDTREKRLLTCWQRVPN